QLERVVSDRAVVASILLESSAVLRERREKLVGVDRIRRVHAGPVECRDALKGVRHLLIAARALRIAALEIVTILAGGKRRDVVNRDASAVVRVDQARAGAEAVRLQPIVIGIRVILSEPSAENEVLAHLVRETDTRPESVLLQLIRRAADPVLAREC